MDTREENPDHEPVGASKDIKGADPSAARRHVLTPEVEPRSDFESPFGALARGLPEVIEKAKDFYSRHPTLVKAVGTVFVAAIARRLFRGRPGLL